MIVHYHYPAHVPVPAQYHLSLEEFKQSVSHFHTTFPDYHFTIELQLAEGNLAATRGTAQGTHNGEYRGLTYKGIPPTGQQVTWTFTSIDRISDGKIVEEWSNGDDLGRLQQPGVLPTPGQVTE